jgi:photosystem II stability/assembly factor-like uncharacterized protein
MVGTEKGAFLCSSGPDRRDWDIEGPIFKGWKVTASGRSPSGRYFMATASQVYGAALHTGSDLKTWRQIEKSPSYPEGGERKLTQIWTINTGPKRHYVGVDTAGLFSSDDDGESWQPVDGLNDHPTRASWFPGAGGLCAHVVLRHPQRPNQLWCGISAVGVFRSDDGGRTFQPKNRGIRCVIPDKEQSEIGFCVHGLAQDPANPDTIFRQDHTGMYRTRNGGDDWEKIENGLPSWFGFPIAMDPHSRSLYAFPMESDEYRLPVDGRCRVYRSRTDGDAWEPTSNGLPQVPYYGSVLRGAMTVDGLEPAGVYVGSTAGDVFMSPDGGESWKVLGTRLPRVLSVQAFVES